MAMAGMAMKTHGRFSPAGEEKARSPQLTEMKETPESG